MPSDSGSDVSRWLKDILYHIHLARSFVAEVEYERFRSDLRTLYAVTRCLEIISEASRRLPDALKARYPSIRWKEMASAGNVYRHRYEDVGPSFVWVTVQDHLAPLLVAIEHELAAQGREEGSLGGTNGHA